MRTQTQSRRIQNTAMKSPSPDIANRNIIKDTRTPIDDVKRYLQKSAQSKSPRISDLSHSARFSHDNTQIQMLRKRINELELRNLQQIDQIKKYMHKIEKLQYDIETYHQHQDFNHDGNTNQDTDRNNLQKMNEKIYQLLDENQRLGGLLKEKQTNIFMITNECKNLKIQIDNIQSQLPKPNTTPIGPLLNINTNQSQESIQIIKNYYLQKIEPGMRRTQNQIMNKFAQLSQRMQIIQENQSKIMQQMKKNILVTPIREKPSVSQNSTHTGDLNDQISGIQPPYNTRPFSSIGGVQSSLSMSGQNMQSGLGSQTNEIMRNLENRISKLEFENENLKKKLVTTQQQLLNEKQLRLLNPTKTNESIENYLKKIHQLENQLDLKIFSETNIQKQLKILQQDYNRLKDKTNRQIYLLENQKNTNKKAYDQQKLKSTTFQQTYTQLLTKTQQIQSILQQKQKQNNQLKNQIRQQIEQKEENIKKYYQDILKNKDKSIGEQLHQYLQTLHSIRQDIQQANIQQVLEDAEQAINSKTNIQKQILSIKQENQIIINQLKRKFIQQEQTIIQLEKDNHLLKYQINELQKQKQKLKKTMFDLDIIKPITTTNITTFTTTNNKFESASKLKTSLKQTIIKINELQQQVKKYPYLRSITKLCNDNKIKIYMIISTPFSFTFYSQTFISSILLNQSQKLPSSSFYANYQIKSQKSHHQKIKQIQKSYENQTKTKLSHILQPLSSHLHINYIIQNTLKTVKLKNLCKNNQKTKYKMNQKSIKNIQKNPQSLLKPQNPTTNKIHIYYHTNSQIHQISLNPYFTVSSTIIQTLIQLNQILKTHLNLNPQNYQLYAAKKDKTKNQDLPSLSHNQIIANTQIKRFYLHTINNDGPSSPIETKNCQNSILSEIHLNGEDKGKLFRKKKEVITENSFKNERKLSFCCIFCCKK